MTGKKQAYHIQEDYLQGEYLHLVVCRKYQSKEALTLE